MKPQKQGSGAKSEVVKRKPDTQIYVLAGTVNWMLTCWCNRAALNPHRRYYTGEVTKAGAEG